MKRTSQNFLLTLIFSTTCLFALTSGAVGFSKGNEFSTQEVSGWVTTFCPNPYGAGSDIRSISCRANLWNPEIRDYFVGPAGVQADKVVLTSTREDGSQRTKDSEYDSSKGLSTKTFNLGISTLTQRPLLHAGVNQIRYDLSLNGQIVQSGNFTVTVKSVPEARCPSWTYHGPFTNSCDNQGFICDQYFNMYNYCQ